MNMDDLIRAVVEAPNVIKSVPFSEVIKATTGYEAYPLDLDGNQKDIKLIKDVSKAAQEYIELTGRTKRRLHADRINETGNAIEEEFVQQLISKGLDAEKLGETGYPDMRLKDSYGRIIYLESKVTSKEWDSSLRSFFYTTGKKIKADARHLLIGWKLKEEADKYWKIMECRLVDLCSIRLNLKSEFNAGNKILYQQTAFKYP